MSIFPTLAGLNIKVTRTPIYATLVQVSAIGAELRTSFQSEPRIKFNLKFNFLRELGFSANTTSDEAQTLSNFFGSMRGASSLFYFVDPYNSSAVQVSLGNMYAGQDTIQLLDSDRAQVTLAMVTAGSTVGDDVVIYVNGVATAITFGIDASGIVTFAAPPYPSGADHVVLTWSGHFWRTVRFAGDEMDYARIVHKVWEVESIDLITVK